MKFFDADSPIMRMLSKMADVFLLNMLTLVCCIPIVTAGAAFTALHYMALKLARNEDCYIVRGFFKSFRQNFKQATIIWLIMLFIFAVIAGDFYLLQNMQVQVFTEVLHAVIMIVAVLMAFVATFVFPVLSKFDNSIKNTIKNAFIVSIMQAPKTILMFILNWLPWVLMYILQPMIPISMMFGFAVPAYASAFLYNKFFKKLEDQIRQANPGNGADGENIGEDERIFKDEPDESIVLHENYR